MGLKNFKLNCTFTGKGDMVIFIDMDISQKEIAAKQPGRSFRSEEKTRATRFYKPE